MIPPPYHLRPNKAADRFFFCDMLARLDRHFDIEKWLYVGMGGPFMDDFRAMLQVFPQMKMVSIEDKWDVHKRQQFHRPAKSVTLLNCTVNEFIGDRIHPEKSTVYWLDFTDTTIEDLGSIAALVERAAIPSVIKVTLKAERRGRGGADHVDGWSQRMLGEYRPEPFHVGAYENEKLPSTLLWAVQRAVERGLSGQREAEVAVLSTVCYTDTSQMVGATFMLACLDDLRVAKKALQGWDLFRDAWTNPLRLSIPTLSIKERLLLEERLPSGQGTGRDLVRRLGYKVEIASEARNENLFDQYRRLYRAYPMFSRVSV